MDMCNFFYESAIAIPQLEGSTSTIAILQLFKEMLLHNRNSAIAIFSEVCNFRAPLPQFLAYF
jgi:phage terminase large subunit-like protein